MELRTRSLTSNLTIDSSRSSEWSSNARENVVETQLKDIYKLLEELKGSFVRLETIGRCVARCYQDIRSLERIHRNKWRFQHGSTAEDPFELRSLLQNFYNTCHSLKYVSVAHEDEQQSADIGCLAPSMPSKRVWRKRQTKAIESDLQGHERNIGLTLTSIVYSTTLKITRLSTTTDLDAASVLQCAERRHATFDRKHASSKSLPDDAPTSDETSWKQSLQKYFKLMESWSSEVEAAEFHVHSSQRAASRTTSLTQSLGSRKSSYQQMCPPVSNDNRFSAYSNFRRGEEMDANNYFRQPRRYSSGAPLKGLVPSNQAATNRASVVDPPPNASQELVLYDPRHSSSSTGTITPRPIRRSSIRGDFHWEYVGRSSTFYLLQPLTTKWPELKDAQVDIYNQTQNMSSTESRAYALGRLAGLSPEITDEVRRVLSVTPVATKQPQKRTNNSRLLTNVSNNVEPVENRRRSMSLDSPAYQQFKSNAANASDRSLALAGKSSKPHLTSKAKSTQSRPLPDSVLPSKKFQPTTPKRGFLGALTEKRPMTAISERSTRSVLSKKSIDKPPSRSLMQSFRNRKNNVSQISILETVPDKVEGAGGRSSSGSDTLTSSKEFDAGDRPTTAQSQKTVATSSTMNIQTPTPTRTKRNYTPKLMAAIFGSKRNSVNLEVPRPESMVSMQSDYAMSQESLRRVSVELLKRRESRMTMISIGENLDIPFDIWLRALPYIEGRCSSPMPA